MNLRKPFEGDSLLEHRMLELIEKHDITAVVETGTETGATANWFAQYVSKVFTCDIEDKLDRHLMDNVSFRLEPSFKAVDGLLPLHAAQHRLLFYLDAHEAPKFCAVRQELEVISHQSLPDCVIVIHDFKVPGHPELGYDTYDAFGDLELSIIEPFLPRIYPGGYEVSYNDKAEGAKRGVCIVEAL
jgi:hypothetical protein